METLGIVVALCIAVSVVFSVFLLGMLAFIAHNVKRQWNPPQPPPDQEE